MVMAVNLTLSLPLAGCQWPSLPALVFHLEAEIRTRMSCGNKPVKVAQMGQAEPKAAIGVQKADYFQTST
jgi:hypothetical protein